jgi:hypothetical protein
MLRQGITPFDDSVGVPVVHILCFYWARAQHRQNRVEFLMRRRLKAEGIVAKIEVEKMSNPIAWVLKDFSSLFHKDGAHSEEEGGEDGSSRGEASLTWIIDFHQLQLKEMIGSGACGQVVRGSYEGVAVAIKRIPLNCDMLTPEDSDGIIEDVKREAMVLAEINHPLLLRFFGVSITAKDVYLVRHLIVMTHCNAHCDTHCNAHCAVL